MIIDLTGCNGAIYVQYCLCDGSVHCFIGKLQYRNHIAVSFLWRVVCFTAATRLSLSFSGNVWRMRSELTELARNTTDDSHYNQDHRRGEDRSRETPTNTRLSCRRPESLTAMYYRSGERARITMRPQTKYARPQGTPSPQISITFGHFNYQPIILHRGPRPKARWYMCTDVANSQNHHNYSPF